MEERLINLEIKITQQDHIIEELNQVIIEQQQRIETLESKLQALVDKYKEILVSSEENNEIRGNEKPPHY